MTEINLAQYYIRKSEIDSALSNSSTNPVQNKVIKNALDTKTTISDVDTEIESYLTSIISQASDYSYILDLVYPIGSIYMSVNNVSPATLFGGTWEQLKDRFLLGAGDSYSNGATGGAASVQLENGHLPAHNHELRGRSWSWGATDATESIQASAIGGYWGNNCLTSKPDHGYTLNHGSNVAHNNMPPYLVVYMWKRTG